MTRSITAAIVWSKLCSGSPGPRGRGPAPHEPLEPSDAVDPFDVPGRGPGGDGGPAERAVRAVAVLVLDAHHEGYREDALARQPHRRTPGTTWAPSTTIEVPSRAARSMSAGFRPRRPPPARRTQRATGPPRRARASPVRARRTTTCRVGIAPPRTSPASPRGPRRSRPPARCSSGRRAGSRSSICRRRWRRRSRTTSGTSRACDLPPAHELVASARRTASEITSMRPGVQLLYAEEACRRSTAGLDLLGDLVGAERERPVAMSSARPVPSRTATRLAIRDHDLGRPRSFAHPLAPLEGSLPRHPLGDRQVDDLSEGGCQIRRSFGHFRSVVHEDHIGPAAGRMPTPRRRPPLQLRGGACRTTGGLEILCQAGTVLQPRARPRWTPTRSPVLRLGCGDRGRGGRCEERVLSSHICERHWEEVGH